MSIGAIGGVPSTAYFYPSSRYSQVSGPTLPVSPVTPVTPVSENTTAGQTNPWYRDGDSTQTDIYGRPVGQDEEKKQDGECHTCKNRKYQDGSNDPGVSFKTPTKMSPQQAQSAVRGHEMEHVTREQAKAKREGREVVAQSVTYQTGVCPECGTVYTAGGTTRTTTRTAEEKTADAYKANMETPTKETGNYLDTVA